MQHSRDITKRISPNTVKECSFSTTYYYYRDLLLQGLKAILIGAMAKCPL